MYLCYIDESGTSDVPGTTSHFVLAGLAIPIYKWKNCENEINSVKRKYDLLNAEIHTGWLIRKFKEQADISGFEGMSRGQRRSEVERYRRAEILRLQTTGGNRKSYDQARKNYKKTEPYIHLTYDERKAFVFEIAQTVGNWGFARLFAECVDKIYYDPAIAPNDLDEQALEQVVSRFEQYLNSKIPEGTNYGLLIHDNNETVAKRHTELMKHFHRRGTFWTRITNIIETPLFVDSSLTSMIQIADVCAYAIRRYLENGEEKLFNEIIKRADRRGPIAVGVRHFSVATCPCKICIAHKATITTIAIIP